MSITRRVTALLLVAGAVLANVAFIGLGSVFDYPDVLQQPAAQVLQKFAADQGSIVTLFFVLAVGAGLLAPVAVLVGRLDRSRLGRWSVRVGIAAASVQVIGLLRWPLFVPSLAARATDPAAAAATRADATDTFEVLHTVLGTVVGETFGYLLTALWTVLVVLAIGRRIAGRWFAGLGLSSAGLILMGVAVPIGLPGADLANFVGYIFWSLWLIGFAVLLWRRPVRQATHPAGAHRQAT
jgi:hypothetical protein